MLEDRRSMSQIMRDLEMKLTRLRDLLTEEVALDAPPIELLDEALKDVEAASEMVQEAVKSAMMTQIYGGN